jgi:glycerophosphoryl diester phosphodiesterase
VLFRSRGLWSPEGPPENSLAAFRAAAEAGLGIEYDVRPSKYGEVMVFHDKNLLRMTGVDAQFEQQDTEDLHSFRLAGSDQPIPTLDALLDIWPNSLPLLTEMKIDGVTDPAAFARSVCERLMTHIGPAAAMSFNEEAVDAVPQAIMRGQLVYPVKRTSISDFDATLARAVERNVDFLGINVADVERAAVTLAGRDIAFVAWTVRNPVELKRVRLLNGAVIFEHMPVPLAS